jgi:hypothetical protein
VPPVPQIILALDFKQMMTWPLAYDFHRRLPVVTLGGLLSLLTNTASTPGASA